MLYNNDDVLFWNQITIDHLNFIINEVNDEFKPKLINQLNYFESLKNMEQNEYYIYRNIKAHINFINTINELNLDIQTYSIKHMIEEGFTFYRILLIINQNKVPIPIIENIKIQQILLPSSIEHINIMKKEITNSRLLKKIIMHQKNLLKLEYRQHQEYIHYSQYGQVKEIFTLNDKIFHNGRLLVNLYEEIAKDHPTDILNHIIKEEKYYLNLITRFKKSFI